MTSFKTFSYEEVLTEIGRKNLNSNLLISDDSPSLLIVIRLLSGSIKLINNYSNTEITCRKNYFANDFKSYGQSWKNRFPELVSNDIKSEDISKFIGVNKHVNRDFYSHLLYEISHFVYESHKKSHTTAFIFIYRLLEKVAFAFPMIYAARTDDFVQSFGQLKELMTGDSEKNELGFFKKFIEVVIPP